MLLAVSHSCVPLRSHCLAVHVHDVIYYDYYSLISFSCPCFRTFYPGLSNAQGFNSAIMTARSQFHEGKRLAAGSLNGPVAVQMA